MFLSKNDHAICGENARVMCNLQNRLVSIQSFDPALSSVGTADLRFELPLIPDGTLNAK
jgi:hypothetical protein